MNKVRIRARRLLRLRTVTVHEPGTLLEVDGPLAERLVGAGYAELVPVLEPELEADPEPKPTAALELEGRPVEGRRAPGRRKASG